ncbi:hypothetical protein HWV62_4934 [Athelia sp. TMB]|nr:hypothetical protein HWV62_4934 [Athelia sp. TMB]
MLNENEDDQLDFDEEPWSDAVLVTPRNSVRAAWNKAALRKHCERTGHTLYDAPAEDTVGNESKPCDLWQQEAVSKLREKFAGGVPHRLELAVGMKAMVTFNTATEADLANGSRGTVEGITLDPREPSLARNEKTGVVKLKYPPAMILFKPLQGSVSKFPGFPEGFVPTFPCDKSFTVKHQGNQKTSIKRRQHAMVAAYAFTDHKAQGQTLEYAIIDIAPTKKFPVDSFSAYVALSRGRGRSKIRILRNFNEMIFTKHPSEYLRLEDQHLICVAEETKEKFDAGYYNFA